MQQKANGQLPANHSFFLGSLISELRCHNGFVLKKEERTNNNKIENKKLTLRTLFCVEERKKKKRGGKRTHG